MDTRTIKQNAYKIIYKQMLALKDFEELYEIYQGLKKTAQDGIPIILKNYVIMDEDEAIAFTEAVLEKLLEKMTEDTKQKSYSSPK